MKKILFALIMIFIMLSCGEKNKIDIDITEDNTSLSIDELNQIKLQLAKKSYYNPENLYNVGKALIKLKVSLDDYNQNEIYKELKMKLVRSENFGDYIAYSGYHFQLIINDFPNSELVDDAAFDLIYIPPDNHNYDDIRITRDKLEHFLKKYPDSNLIDIALKRISIFTKDIESGAQTIYD